MTDSIINLTIILLFLSLITFSFIGYGVLFVKIFYLEKNNSFSVSHYSIFGMLFLVFVSYYSNLFLSHNEIFNSLLILIGIFNYIFFFKIKKKKE